MKKTHEENRLKVCLLCFGKVKQAKHINNSLKQTIKDRYLPDYDESNEIYPKVLCGSCYIALYRCNKGEKLPKIQVHKYPDRRINLRTGSHVDCDICRVAQQTLQNPVTNFSKGKKASKFVKICKVCLTQVGPGKAHECNKYTKLQNLAKMADGSQDQLVSMAIREKTSKDQPVASIANQRGKPTRVKVVNAKEKENKTPISHEDVFQWKTDLDLSTRKVCCIKTFDKFFFFFLIYDCFLNPLFCRP